MVPRFAPVVLLILLAAALHGTAQEQIQESTEPATEAPASGSSVEDPSAPLAETRPPVDRALDAAEKRISQNSRDASALLALGNAAWRAGQLARAAEVFESCLRIETRHAGAQSGLSRWHRVHGRLEEAERLAREAIATAPGDGNAWLAWSEVLLRQDRLEECEQALARTLQRFQNQTASREIIRRASWILESVRTRRQHPVDVEVLKRKGRVEVRLVGRRPVVDVELPAADGQPLSVPVLLDTGGTYVVALDESLRDRVLFQETGRRRVETLQAPTELAVSGELSRLIYGNWSFSRVPVVFLPIPQSEGAEERVLGNLGPWLVPDRVWILNFRRGYVSVMEPRRDGKPFPQTLGEDEWQMPFLIVDGKAVVSFEAPGGQVLGLVDTGAARTRLSERFAARGQLPALQIGGKMVRVDHGLPHAGLDQTVSPRLGVEISVLLGMDVLGRYGIVTLDYATQTLTLTPRGENRR